MAWLKSNWKATAIGIVVFLIGVGIGVAGKASTKTRTRTVAGPTVTVTQTVNHVQIRYRTRVVRQVVKPPPAPPPAPPPPPSTLRFSGNGGLTLRPFDLSHDATLYWTDDGGLMQILATDPTAGGNPVPVNSQASSGQTFLPAGHYSWQVNSLGNWTITIK